MEENRMEYKGYLITVDKKMPTSYRVATAGKGGKIPAVLEGLFTSTGIARFTIDEYLNSKEVNNGKTSN